MRHGFLYLLLLMLAGSASGQQSEGPDTLDWRLYYPLEVGNVWEWETWLLVDYTGFDRREIIADTLINGIQYFLETRYEYAQSPVLNWESLVVDTTLLHYDTLNAQVVKRSLRGGEERQHTCPLNTDFGRNMTCGNDPYYDVGGGYAEERHFLIVGEDTVRYNAVKRIYSIGGGSDFYHGVGRLQGIGDGQAGEIKFTYIRVGGIEYGQRAVLTAIDDELLPTESSLAAYPNPVRDRLTVAFERPGPPFSLAIYDVLGRAVIRNIECTRPICAVDTSRLWPGLYFARVVNETSVQAVTRFVVIR